MAKPRACCGTPKGCNIPHVKNCQHALRYDYPKKPLAAASTSKDYTGFVCKPISRASIKETIDHINAHAGKKILITDLALAKKFNTEPEPRHIQRVGQLRA